MFLFLSLIVIASALVFFCVCDVLLPLSSVLLYDLFLLDSLICVCSLFYVLMFRPCFWITLRICLGEILFMLILINCIYMAAICMYIYASLFFQGLYGDFCQLSILWYIKHHVVPLQRIVLFQSQSDSFYHL